MNHDFKTMQEMVTRLRATNSNNAKKDILKEYSDNEFIRQCFLYTMSPYKQYGVRPKTIKKLAEKLTPTLSYDNLFTLLDDLDSRTITGHAAAQAVLGFISINQEYEELIYAILGNDLQTRTSSTTINKIFDNVVPTFSVALAKAYAPTDCEFEKEEWYASRKLDGVRCLIFTGPNNNPKALSRSGKPFETVQRVLDDIKSLNMPNMVFDGEICLVDENGNDDFNGIMRVIKRKDFTIENPKFKIFDMITQADFDNEVSETILTDRLSQLEQIEDRINNVANGTLDILYQELCDSQEIFDRWADEVKENNWEGFMLRKNTVYQGKRSSNLLKVKTMMDEEYTVKAVTNGLVRHVVFDPAQNKNVEIQSEMVSNLIIEHKGSEVGVGSGLSLQQRMDFYNDPSSIIGKQITVQYFEESQDKSGNYSLRFPVLKHVYETKRDC